MPLVFGADLLGPGRREVWIPVPNLRAAPPRAVGTDPEPPVDVVTLRGTYHARPHDGSLVPDGCSHEVLLELPGGPDAGLEDRSIGERFLWDPEYQKFNKIPNGFSPTSNVCHGVCCLFGGGVSASVTIGRTQRFTGFMTSEGMRRVS